jgi:hypothetical protein
MIRKSCLLIILPQLKRIIFSVCILTSINFKGFSQVEIGSASSILQKTDSIRAVEHLYKRKRTWGAVKIVTFAVVGGITVAKITKDDPGTGQPYSGDADINDFLFIGVSTIMVLNGISETSRYSKKNLKKHVTRYNDGKRLPTSILSKLRMRDFK